MTFNRVHISGVTGTTPTPVTMKLIYNSDGISNTEIYSRSNITGIVGCNGVFFLGKEWSNSAKDNSITLYIYDNSGTLLTHRSFSV